jgi:hypothetical protein
MDQGVTSGDVQAKIAIYDEKIKTEKENIEANRKALKQMDEGVDQVLGRSTTETGAEKAVAMRRTQQKERARLQSEISQSQKSIAELNDARAPIAAEVRKVDAEVGPIKYIAALMYGDNPDANLLERAVRWMIIMIVLVFDPLALTLILASNKQFEWARQGTGGFVHDEPKYEPDDGPLTNDQIEQIQASAEPPKEDKRPWNEQYPYLTWPFVHFENLKPMVAPDPARDSLAEIPDVETHPWTAEEIEALNVDTDESEKAAIKAWKAANPDDTIKAQRVKLTRGEITELPWMGLVADNVSGRKSHSGFGINFPEQADKGDTFMRVDIMPNRLYKYNGSDWMAVDKNLSNSYTYDSAYIEHLIDKISTGEYDPDLLSESEREQVAHFLETKKS